MHQLSRHERDGRAPPCIRWCDEGQLHHALLGTDSERGISIRLRWRPTQFEQLVRRGEVMQMRGCRSFRGGRMLLAAPIAASVLVSCAEPPHVGALDVPTKTLSVQAEIDQLHERIMGSAADRSAGEFLTYMKVQGTLRTCMAETGFVYSPPLFVDPYANRAVPSPDFLQEIVPVDAMSVNLHGLSVSSSYGD